MTVKECSSCGDKCGHFTCQERKYALCDCPTITPGRDACNALHDLNDNKIKLMAQRNESLLACDIPKFLGRLFRGTSCVYKNMILQLCWIIKNICCIYSRTKVIDENNKCINQKQEKMVQGMKDLQAQMNKILELYNQYATTKIVVADSSFEGLVATLEALPEEEL